jgi:hypothetical protein
VGDLKKKLIRHTASAIRTKFNYLKTDFGKNFNTKFHKNLSNRSHAVPCGQKDGWMATHDRT